MSFFATYEYLRGNLRVRLATQRKSLRKFNLHPLATTCRSVWPRLYIPNADPKLLESESTISFNTTFSEFDSPKPIIARDTHYNVTSIF